MAVQCTPFTLLGLTALIGAAALQAQCTGDPIFADHFDDGSLAAAWQPAPESGWSITESGTELTMTDGLVSGQWDQLSLTRSHPQLTDFCFEAEFSWDSEDQTAAQMTGGFVIRDVNGAAIVGISNVDDADGTGLRRSLAGGNVVDTAYDFLGLAGSATVKFTRAGDTVTAYWDDVEVVSGTATEPIAEVQFVVDMFFDYGSFSIDRAELSGTAVDTDGDSIPDHLDLCPLVPNTTADLCTVLEDDFDDSTLDQAWGISFENASDWTYSENESALTVTDIARIADDSWASVYLQQTFVPVSDFVFETAFSWDCEDSDAAMQGLLIVLQDAAGGNIATIGHTDAWISARGQRSLAIGDDDASSGNDFFPYAGSATVTVSRGDDVVTVLWDGEPVHSGTVSAPLAQIVVRLQHFPSAEPSSLFGSYDLDLIRVSGTPLDGDGDGVPDYRDNCPGIPNADQADTDANGFGDVCNCLPAPAGLVSWWPLDEGSGGAAGDLLGSNPGTISGAVFAAGVGGTALSFDGINDYVSIPDAPGLRLTDAITVAFWVNPATTLDSTTAFKTLVTKNDASNANNDIDAWELYYATGFLVFTFRIQGEDASSGASFETDLAAGTWHHVAATYDRENARLYLDGQVVASTPETRAVNPGTTELAFGADSGSKGLYFAGLLDEVEIYGRALTESEVAAIHAAGVTTRCRALDTDLDGVTDGVDNCPDDANTSQADGDADGVGDLCDLCPQIADDQTDSDGDGVGEACDNCPSTSNTDQSDADSDMIGDPCDTQVQLDIYDWDVSEAEPVGQISSIVTAQTGAAHYNYTSASGHPSGVKLGNTISNIWVHESSITRDLTFGFIFGIDNTAPSNSASVNFRIIGSDTDPSPSQSDDPGEADESPPGSNAFVGVFNYGVNTDGIAVSGIRGSGWTIIIDSVNFGNITQWRAANGETTAFTDDLILTLGHEYRIVPAGQTPSILETNPQVPSGPSPAHGATNVSLTPQLQWQVESGAGLVYDVYFGTAASPPKVVTGQSALTYDPGRLSSAQTYYWKIVSRGSDTFSSDLWRFTTRPLPDLTPESLSVTPGTVGTRDPFTVSWQTANRGTLAATADWQERIWLSTNDQLGGDLQIDLAAETSDLAIDGTLARSVAVTLDGVDAGDYWLIVELDGGQAVTEDLEDNNVAVIPLLLRDPVRVTAQNPSSFSNQQLAAVGLTLSRAVTTASGGDGANYQLLALGLDRLPGTADDQNLLIDVSYSNTTVSLELASQGLIDLHSWSTPDTAGNWIVAADGNSVFQSINGNTTRFVSDFDFIDQEFTGLVKVETANDDDWIGLVWGFLNNANLYEFRWKQANQDASLEGFTITKYASAGNSTLATFFNTSVGWLDNKEYAFTVRYESSGSMRLTVTRVDNSQLLWDITVTDPSPHGAGKVGFMNASQEAVRYRGLQTIELLPEGAYQVTARSNGLLDSDGIPLDGNGDLASGDDYVGSFYIDLTPPALAAVAATSTLINVSFDDEGGVDPTSAETLGLYALTASGDGAFDNGDDADLTANLTAVSFDQQTQSATLTVSPALGPDTYRITVAAELADLAGNAMGAAATADFSLNLPQLTDITFAGVPLAVDAELSLSDTLAAVFADDSDVVSVEFKVDETVIGVDNDGSDGFAAFFSLVQFAPGPATVTVTATNDVGLSAALQRNVVLDPNLAPVFEALTPLEIDEQVQFQTTIVATGPEDGQQLTYSLDSAPAGAAIDAVSGILTWTPSEAQGPAQHQLTVRATDDGDGTLASTAELTISVAEVDRPPTLSPTTQTAVEHGAFSYFVPAADPDIPTVSLTYALVEPILGDMDIDAASGELTWTPTGFAQSQTVSVDVQVTEQSVNALTATATLNIDFIKRQTLTLLVSPDGAGTTTGAGVHNWNADTTITATANTLWRFDHWEGEAIAEPANAGTTVNMSADRTVTAVFVKQWQLQTSTAGGGTVSGSGVFDENLPVPVTATPDHGYRFDHWDGPVAAAELPQTTVTMTENTTVTATFVFDFPDLVVSAVSAPATVTAGRPATVQWTVLNDGTQSLTGVLTDTVLIADNAGGAGAVELGQSATPAEVTLAVDGTLERSLEITVPVLPVGDYYFLVRTNSDLALDEADHTFNNETVDDVVSALIAVDLVVDEVAVEPGEHMFGQPSTVNWTLRNAGAADTFAAWSDRLALVRESDGLRIALADVAVEQLDLPIAATGTLAVQATVTIVPAAGFAGGDYRIEVSANGDAGQAEPDTGNNATLSDLITVLDAPAPDLTPTALASDRQSAGFGENLELSWTVLNDADPRSLPLTGGWQDGLWLSLDDQLDPATDYRLGHLAGPVATLGPRGEYMSTRTVTLPLDPTLANLPYFILAEIDETAALTEIDDENNLITVAVTLTRIPGPRIVSMTPTGTVDRRVSSIAVEFDKAVAAATFSAADVTLTGPAGSISAAVAQVSPAVFRVFFEQQQTNGLYQLTVGPALTDLIGNPMDQDGDAVNGEAGEDVFTDSFTIAISNLQPTVLETDAAALFGDQLTVRWTVTNVGGTAAIGLWEDTLWLSLDDQLDVESDLRLAIEEIAAAPVEPAGSYQVETTAVLPLDRAYDAGNYYLIVVADSGSDLIEGNETDNRLASEILALDFPDLPDLAVSDVQHVTSAVDGQRVAAPGSQVTVSWLVHNNGPGALTASSWTDRVYVSVDDVVGDDRAVAKVTHSTALAVDEQLEATATFTLPSDGPDGDVYFIVRTDTADTVLEANEDDNFAAGTITTHIPTTMTLSPPASVDEGAQKVRVVVQRSGSVAQPLTVHLTASVGVDENGDPIADNSELSVPATVVIPAGQASVSFLINALDDGIVDGDQTVILRARADTVDDDITNTNPAGELLGNVVVDNRNIIVRDTDVPAITITAIPESLAEGETGALSFTLEPAPRAAMLVRVEVSPSEQLGGSAFVTLPAGLAAAEVPITAIQDQLPELVSRMATVRVSAAGYASASAELTVLDDDDVALNVSFTPSTVTEGTLGVATNGVVSRARISSRPLAVNLHNGNPQLIWTPARVTIPANEPSASFNVVVIDDSQNNGTRTVDVEAVPNDAFEERELARGQGVATLTVLDDDGATLQLRQDRQLIAEDGSTTATVVRNTTDNSAALTVSLSADPSSEVSLPASVTIPIDSDRTTFSVAGVSDSIPDGNQTVTLTASAPDFNDGVSTLVVSDVDFADLRPVDLAADALVEAGAPLTISWSTVNEGLAAATGPWVERAYLSKDDRLDGSDLLVDTVSESGSLASGAVAQRSRSLTAPIAVGTYRLLVHVDPADRVEETIETNNLAVASATIEIAAGYSATVAADASLYVTGALVTASGSATLAAGGSAIRVPVAVWLRHGGTVRSVMVTTDDAGDFVATFQLLDGEGGAYELTAGHPGVLQSQLPGADSFTVLGMRTVERELGLVLSPNRSYSGTFDLRNLSDAPLTDLSATIAGLPADVSVTFDLPQTLAGNSVATVNLSVTVGASPPAGYSDGTIQVSSAEGVGISLPVTVLVRVPQPVLSGPTSLTAGMLRGRQTPWELTVRNTGGGETGPLQVLMPQTSWLRLATASPLPSLAPGESATITLMLAPDPTLPLGPYRGSMAVGNDRCGLNLPFEFRNVSDALGDVLITVVDERTFHAPDEPNLEGARVVLRDPFTSAVVAQAESAADGTVLFTDVAEGTYNLEATASGHDGHRSTVAVLPGQTTEKTVFLRTRLVTYNWRVEPIEIEDRYEVTVETVFATNVPTPVVVIEPSVIDLSKIDSEAQVVLQIENKGLIAAKDAVFDVPTHPQWEIIPLVTELGDIPAKGKVSLPITIRRTAARGDEGDLTMIGLLKWLLICGPFSVEHDSRVTFVNARPQVVGSIGRDRIWDGGGVRPSPRPRPVRRSTAVGSSAPSLRVSVAPPSGTFYEPAEDCTCDKADFKPKCLKKSGDFEPETFNEIIKGVLSNASPPWLTVKELKIKFSAEGKVCTCCSDGVQGLLAAGKVGVEIEGVLIVGFNQTITYESNTSLGEGELTAEFFIGGELKLKGAGEVGLTTGCNFSDPDFLCSFSASAEAFVGGRMAGSVAYPEGASIKAFGEAGFSTGVTIAYDCDKGESGCFLGATLVAKYGLETEVENDDGSKDKKTITVDLSVPIAEPCCFPRQDNGDCSPPPPGNENPNEINIEPFADPADAREVCDSCGTAHSADAYPPLPLADTYRSVVMSDLEYEDQQRPLPDPDAAAARGVDNGVCAQVRLQIEQEITMTRRATAAVLELSNNSPDVPLTEIRVDLDVFDENLDLATDRFVILDPVTTNLTQTSTGEPPPDFDPATEPDLFAPTWEAPPSSVSTLRWVILPTETAAADGPTLYRVGGTLRYTLDGVPTSIMLAPGAVTVYPDARLQLRYFQQRDVYSDDPFTSQIEPAEPFSLAVMVQNIGSGAAEDFQITSAQPRIISNVRGLLIDFTIIATELNGQSLSSSLTANFGTIEPNDLVVAQWFFTSPLQGHFIEYNAAYQHTDALGGEVTSLIDSLSIHEMIRPVRDHTFDDELPDFLVNDIEDPLFLPDTLYASDGTVESVALASFVSASNVSAQQLTSNLVLTHTAGWNYLRFADPGGSQFQLVAVTRGDSGASLPPENFWQTDRSFIEVDKRPIDEDLVHLLDYDGPGAYTLTYEPRDRTGPQAVTVTQVPQPLADAAALPAIEVSFSEPLQIGSFDVSDISLLRGTSDLITDQTELTLTTDDGVLWQIDGLEPLLDSDGEYLLLIDGSGVADVFNNVGSGMLQSRLVVAAAAPAIVSIPDAPGGTISSTVTQLTVTFSSDVLDSFGNEDLQLSRAGQALATTAVTIAPGTDEMQRLITGLDGLTDVDGSYQLTIDATGVSNAAGTAGVGVTVLTWTRDGNGPTLVSVTGLPAGDVNYPVHEIGVTFSEAPSGGLQFDDLSLTRNGSEVALTAATVSETGSGQYRVAGLGTATTPDGVYRLTIDAAALSDAAGNAGSGVFEQDWTTDTEAPAAPTNMRVTPDTGTSADDGLTKELTVTVSGDLPEPGLTVVVRDARKRDEISRQLASGTHFEHTFTIHDTGNQALFIDAIDAAGNIATGRLRFFIDIQAPRVNGFLEIPRLPVEQAVDTLIIVLSEPPADLTLPLANLSLSRDGEPVALAGRSITIEQADLTGSRYRVSGLAAVADAAGVYTLTVAADGLEDRAGNVGSGAVSTGWTMALSNDRPTVQLSSVDSLVDEGSQVTVSGTVTDADNGPWSGTVDFGCSSCSDDPLVFSGDPAQNFSDSHTATDDGTYFGRVRVSDATGESDFIEFEYSVRNVAPGIAALRADRYAAGVGEQVSITAKAVDPANTSRATRDPLTYHLDFGDGTTAVVTNTSGQHEASFTAVAAHSYDAPGDYTVAVYAEDDDGGASTVSAIEIAVGVIYVDAAAAAGGDGSSWAAALPTIGDALATAATAPGSQVWVAGGVYRESLTLPDGIALYGGFAGNEGQRGNRDLRTRKTIIDATGAEVGVEVAASGRLDGLIITGAANGVRCIDAGPELLLTHLVVAGNTTGLSCDSADLAVRNCLFAGNELGVNSDGGNLSLTHATFAHQITGLSLTSNTTGVVSYCLFDDAASAAALAAPDIAITAVDNLFEEGAVSAVTTTLRSDGSTYEVLTNLTTLSATAAGLPPGALTGRLILTGDGLWVVAGNTADSVTVVGDVGDVSLYQLVDLRPRHGSAVLDAVDVTMASADDILATPRPTDIPEVAGTGTVTADIGAFEARVVPRATLPLLNGVADLGSVIVLPAAAQAGAVQLRNIGHAPLSVTDLSLAGNDDGQFVLVTTAPLVLEAGAETTIDVSFEPTSVGSREVLLQIASDDPELPLLVAPITAAAIPTTPMVGPDQIDTDEDTATTTANVLENDHEPHPDLTLALLSYDATSATGATVTDLGDGVFGYDPRGVFDHLPAGVVGNDSFSYTVGNENGGTNTGTVSIHVTGINDDPQPAADALTTDESSAIVPLLLDNDTDPDDSDGLTVSAIDTAGTLGTVTLIDTVVTYDPAGVFDDLETGETATDSFTYTARDTAGSTAAATATVTINGITREVPIEAGWNLISFPVTPTQADIDLLLGGQARTAEERLFWTWIDGRLRTTDELVALRGYWVFGVQPVSLRLAGDLPATLTVTVEAGWNLIGSPIAGVLVDEAGILAGGIWYWDAATDVMAPVAQLERGRGYWVFATRAGALRLEQL